MEAVQHAQPSITSIFPRSQIGTGNVGITAGGSCTTLIGRVGDAAAAEKPKRRATVGGWEDLLEVPTDQRGRPPSPEQLAVLQEQVCVACICCSVRPVQYHWGHSTEMEMYAASTTTPEFPVAVREVHPI